MKEESKKAKEIVDKWFSTNEPHKVSGLKEGQKYNLQEEGIVDVWVKASYIQFEVTTDKETQHIVMIDKIVTMSKVDVGGKEIEGAEIVVTDKDGNIVSVTQTINYFWGNGYMPEGTGFFLNNELSSFSFTPSSVHYIQPYKQPVSHIMPTIIMKDGNPWATLGSPGGLRIPSAVIQVVLNLIDFDMDIQSAIAAPRVYTYAASNSDSSSVSKDLYVENDQYKTLIKETEHKS